MNVGKRILAFIIDFYLCNFFGLFLVAGSFYIMEKTLELPQLLGISPGSFEALLFSESASSFIFGYLVLSLWFIFWPSLFLGLCSHLFGKSFGKRLFGLSVINCQGTKPAFGPAFGREFIKICTLFIPFMWLLPLIQALLQGATFYDFLFGTSVLGVQKLTAVQKKYRRQMRYR